MRRINQHVEQQRAREKFIKRNEVKALTIEHRQKFAKRRLMRDYLEMMKNPLPTVQARPLDDNIFEWHCNLVCSVDGPYKNFVFHFIIEFSDIYPVKAPAVKLCNYLGHRHVFNFDGHICLDMLETHDNPTLIGTGWSSGYTLHSILIQLQSFLLDPEELLPESFHAKKSMESIKQFRCNKCSHCIENPYPVLPYFDLSYDEQRVETRADQSSYRELGLYLNDKYYVTYELLQQIFRYADIETLRRGVNNTCKTFQNILANDETYKLRNEICCYHSKMTFEQAVLGYGINVQYKGDSKNPQYITAKLDLISYFAVYKEGIEHSMWKEPFEFWLPIYINQRHGKVVLADQKFLHASVERIYEKKFHPQLALDLLTKLMNSMIVTMMNNSIHTSLNALDGYISFHRMLIALIDQYPMLKKSIETKIQTFIENPESRTKGQTSSIGDFLPYLTVSELYGWPDVAIPVLQEVMCRNVLWCVNKHFYLNAITSQDHWYSSREAKREKDSFEASIVSLRLIMFHVCFLKRFSPQGRKLTLSQIAQDYDSRFGLATNELKNDFQQKIFNIMKVNNFKNFFKHCCLVIKNNHFVDEMLTDAWMRSKANKYHL